MGLKNSQYHAIMRKYEQKQLHSHDIQVAGMKKSIKSSLNSKHLMTPLPHCLFSTERNYLMEIPVQLML